jgi:hypothetical protein
VLSVKVNALVYLLCAQGREAKHHISYHHIPDIRPTTSDQPRRSGREAILGPELCSCVYIYLHARDT